MLYVTHTYQKLEFDPDSFSLITEELTTEKARELVKDQIPTFVVSDYFKLEFLKRLLSVDLASHVKKARVGLNDEILIYDEVRDVWIHSKVVYLPFPPPGPKLP